MKNRKVHFTESQINEIMDKLNEANSNGTVVYSAANSFQNVPVDKGVEIAKDTAMRNPSMDVYIDGQKIDSTTNVQQTKTDLQNAAKDIMDGMSESKKCFTKKQLKEAKLRYLRENSISYSKKDFTENLFKK